MGEVTEFFFRGEIPASKSVLIRDLLCQAYEPRIEIQGDSECDDVQVMKRALAAFARGETRIDCGEAGLVLRLLLGFASRRAGEFLLTGSSRLLSRPHHPLIQALGDLGARITREECGFRVRSEGWKNSRVQLDPSTSSQFLSALVLNAWELPFELTIELTAPEVSSGYFEISSRLAEEFGMKLMREGRWVRVLPSGRPRAKTTRAEADLSSAFAVAALGAAAGSAEILAFPEASLQPDRAFIPLLQAMGVPIQAEHGVLRVGRASELKAISANLGESPDLFPVLGVLAALAPGGSKLFGAPHLRGKESDRIEETAKLLEAMGREVLRREDGLEIGGKREATPTTIESGDHRIVMAAILARWAGFPIEVRDAHAVGKSFPEFLEIANPLTLVIGHRGVGKSSFLARAALYLGSSAETLDLDREIEKRAGKSVQEIFEKDGESEFRRLEEETLMALAVRSKPRWIALGAGYSGKLPKGARVLWLKRRTDASGRVFLDRPRLNSGVSPLEEFRERLAVREKRYAELADEIWIMGEGEEQESAIERDFVLGRRLEVGGVFCVFPQHLRTLHSKLRWEGTRFELRDDLLTPEELAFALREIPADRVIYSFRKGTPRELPYWIDCPVESGVEVRTERQIRSLHERREGESVADCAARLRGPGIFKLSLEITSFAELETGHRWMMEDPARRVFLPRGNGKWSWYRLWISRRAPVSFFRDGEGSAPDQPTLFEWLKRGHSPDTSAFAAVLGDPVLQSRTPAEHSKFFGETPVFAIPVSERDWDEGAIDVLRRLGLRYAAVTAPLKERAGRLVGAASPLNTLIYDQGWKGCNTDLEGFKKLSEQVPAGASVAVWGGGGTLESIRNVLPSARFFSARTGRDRETGESDFEPQVVVWAVGRSRELPFPTWKPELVLDLNYAEDSPGREYALLTGARYVSGLAMFRAQAEGQRKFWRENGRK